MSEFPVYSFAFQPIVDIAVRQVYAYESLVRGLNNEPPSFLFSKVSDEEMLPFTTQISLDTIKKASELGITTYLNLNFIPRTFELSGDYIVDALDSAYESGFPSEKIVIEVIESEVIQNQKQFKKVIDRLRSKGLKVAIDDFGAGYSGLNLLADFQPDFVKLDMHLVKNIQFSGPRQAIVRAIHQVCFDLGIDLIAEGVETKEEFDWLFENGIELFQGFFFAKPGFECLPDVLFPDVSE